MKENRIKTKQNKTKSKKTEAIDKHFPKSKIENPRPKFHLYRANQFITNSNG